MRHLCISLLALISLVVVGCTPAAAPTAIPTLLAPTPTLTLLSETRASGPIKIVGSTTMHPLVVEWVELFKAEHPDAQLEVQGGGSALGVELVGQGTADVGMVSRDLTDTERRDFPEMRMTRVGGDIIVIAVHPEIGVTDLTREQVRLVFSGQITNWSSIGGPDDEITVFLPEPGSGTRSFFEEMAMGTEPIAPGAELVPSQAAMADIISSTPGSVGILSLAFVDDGVKALTVESGDPLRNTDLYVITTGLSRRLYLLTKGEPTGTVAVFIEFTLSQPAQQAMAGRGYQNLATIEY